MRRFSTTKVQDRPYVETAVISNIGLPPSLSAALIFCIVVPSITMFFIHRITSGDGSIDYISDDFEWASNMLLYALHLNRGLLVLLDQHIFNVASVDPAMLRSILPILKSIIELNEMIFASFTPVVNRLWEDSSLYVEVNSQYENLRRVTNTVAESYRLIEDRLDLPLDERLAWFWFEG